jgi:CRP/FNR family transcriptional regulator
VDQSCLADRLGRYLHLVEPELEALAALEDTERMVPRGNVLRAEHSGSRECYVVRRGWLYSSMLLFDGNRQILSMHLPGEIAGEAGLPWDKAPFTITAATDTVVRVIDKAALRGVLEKQPRIGALLLMLAQIERVVLADRLASIGRTSAKSRVAALLIDVLRRLRASGDPLDSGMPLPLTQEEIGDATGLTAVHVNRMMRQLSDERLITRGNGRIRIINEAQLAGISNHVDRYAALDLSWLPPAPR